MTRRDRKRLIRARLEALLQRRPMSKYAMSRLWRMSQGKQGKRLRTRYQRRVQQYPQKVPNRVILARLCVLFRDWKCAIPQLQWVLQHRPKWRAVRQLLFQSQLSQGKPKPALATFRVLWPGSKRKARGRMLLQLTTLSLMDASKPSLEPLLPLIKAHPWSSREWASWGRLWLRYKRGPLGLAALQRAIEKTSGAQKTRLWIERLQAMATLKRDALALRQLAAMRRTPRLARWAKDALFALELKLQRRSGKFYSFLLRLQRRWLAGRIPATQRYQKLVRLGALFASIKAQEALGLYRQALVVQPRGKVPRLFLIQHFFRAKRPREAYREMAQLILHKQAGPSHVLGWSRYVLRTDLDRPVMPDWRPQWGERRLCRRLRHKPRVMPERINRCHYKRTCLHWVQCADDLWGPFRLRVWAGWAKRATSDERALFGKVVSALRGLIDNYPTHWSAMYDTRQLLADLGQEAPARRAYVLLLQHMKPIAAQVKAMLKLLKRHGQSQRALPLLRGVLRRRSISPLHSLQLAELAYQTIEKKQRVCHAIRSSLQRAMRSLPSAFVQRRFGQALRMVSLRWRCRDRSTPLHRWLTRLAVHAAPVPKRLLLLLSVATKGRMSWFLRKQLSQRRPQKEQRALIESWSNTWPKANARTSARNGGDQPGPRKANTRKLPTTMRWLKQISRAVYRRNPWPLVRWFQVACETTRGCAQAKGLLPRLLQDRRLLLPTRFGLLALAHKRLQLTHQRRRWVRRLLKTRGFRPGVGLLVTRGSLFYDIVRLSSLHLRLLKMHFVTLSSPLLPKRFRLWSGHLVRYVQHPSTQSNACQMGQRLLREALRQWKPRWFARSSKETHLMGALLFQCHKVGKLEAGYLARLGREVVAHRSDLFQFFVAHRLTAGIQFILAQKPPSAHTSKSAAQALFGGLSPKQRAQFVTGIQRQCFASIDSVPGYVHRVLHQVCVAEAPLCAQVFRCFYALMHSKTRPAKLLHLLDVVRRQLHSQPAYRAFLVRLIQYWTESVLSEGWMKERDFAGLAQMAELPTLFQSNDLKASATLTRLHYRLLLYVLSRRTTMPEKAGVWLKMLRSHLQPLGDATPTSVHAANATLLQKSAPRSPVMNAFRLWLQPAGDVLVQSLQKQRSAQALTLAKPARSLWLLGPMYPLFRYPKAIEEQWRLWFAKNPAKTTRKAIALWTKRCCLDDVDRRMALRLAQLGLRLYGPRKMRIEILRVLPKLTVGQRKILYRALGGYRSYFQMRMRLRK